MKVRELIEHLHQIEDKEQNVYVWTFADVGGYSDSTTDIKIEIDDKGIHLIED